MTTDHEDPADGHVALRTFFDEELLRFADVATLVQHTATFVAAPVGLDLHDERYAFDADGASSARSYVEDVASIRVIEGCTVWIDRSARVDIDQLLERMAFAVTLALRMTLTSTRHSSPLEVLFDEASSESSRHDALDVLSINSETAIIVVLFSGPAEGVDLAIRLTTASLRLYGRVVRGDVVGVLIAAPPDGRELPHYLPDVPTGVRVAHSRPLPARRATDALANAHDAYLFARPSPHDRGPYQPVQGVLIDGARLQGLSALCRLSASQIAEIEEIAVIDRLVAQHGEDFLHLIEAYSVTGSLRKTATQMFLHHNTVAYWVQKTEAELGFSLAESNRRALFFVTICLYRLYRQAEASAT